MPVKFCPGCGASIYLKSKYFSIEHILCEECEHQFTAKDHGKAKKEDIARAQADFQKLYERESRGMEPTKRVLARMGHQVAHNPETRKRPGRVIFNGGGRRGRKAQ